MIDALLVISRGIGTTVAITGLSFLFGALLALPITSLRRSTNPVARAAGTGIVEGVRSVPSLVWLFIIFYSVGSDLVPLDTFQASIVGFTIISSVYLAEVYRGALDAVPAGQWEAANALGLGQVPMMIRVILPQAVLLTIPPSATFAIGLLKDSAAASIIGAVDITFLANQTARTSGDPLIPFLAAAAFYLLLSIPIAVAARGSANWIERKLRTA